MGKWLTPDQIAIVVRDYPNTNTAELAKRMGMDEDKIRDAAINRGVYKSPEFKAANRSRLANLKHGTGRPAHNKGKPQVVWMSKDGLARSIAARFQNGHPYYLRLAPYPEELHEAISLLNRLNKAINEKQDRRP